MGVPKFFRYISERYPCLSEVVKEYQIPEFDNLYLDMNGIIHNCSHPDDENVHFRITEEQIFKDIFHYIEVLFRMIKPQKLFFMAIDGVAPRAKINQQRGRRFRSAKDAEKREIEASKRGEVLPDQERFDSNCITPGTLFMAKLHEQLKYFVTDKISTDVLWQGCKVILSGHETPGEGEHKIMDYIRYMRAQPGYDPNTRHCLYGLDADLIMLGLCTHDPHFSLLREEVKFGKKSSKRVTVPEEITFFLLHLSLMREYLELEFAELKTTLTNFQFNIENIIDDWVLMGFLVGNDFIPHLPNLHITEGALPILYKVYIEVLPTLDGYINEGGDLNLKRFEKFMQKLSSFDLDNFEEVRDDLLYMEAKTGRKQTAHSKVSTKPRELAGENDDDIVECPSSFQRDSGLASLIQAASDFAETDDEECDENTDNSEDDAFINYKREYYQNKMEFEKVTPQVMREQAEGYVRAIQWNLNYYYNGCCSWSWYYPHHYAPYISDIKGFSNLDLKFDYGRPFLPFEQLLAVLPPASKNLLPTAYHGLMTDEYSLIKKYYPDDFETDLNGKKQEWEAVVLVPFIDEDLLLKAMDYCNDKLSEEEAKRNKHGPMLIYFYTPEDHGPYAAPEYFPPVTSNHTVVDTKFYDDIIVPKEKLIKGAYPGAKMNVFYPGFPTMKHLKYKAELRKAKIKVFDYASRGDNMFISLLPSGQASSTEMIPVDLLGTNGFVRWPHLIEAKIVAISNSKRKYVDMGQKQYNIEDQNESIFQTEINGITEFYANRMGISVGETKVLVYVKTLMGKKYSINANGHLELEKQFAPNISYYPLQALVYDIKSYEYDKTIYQHVGHIFPKNAICFTLTNPYYGSTGRVQENMFQKNGRMKITVTVQEEPDFSHVWEYRNQLNRNYKTLHSVASQLAISGNLFSRITGSIFMKVPAAEATTKNVNIGLDLKMNKKNLETPGYTRKLGNTWHYSDKSVALVKEYAEHFPEVFEYLSESHSFDDINPEDIFKENCEQRVEELKIWLRSIPTYKLDRQICGSIVLEPDVIAEIENTVERYKSNKVKNVTMQIKPHFLYRPEIQTGSLLPDPKMDVKLMDRVVNVRIGYSVPFGHKGTITAIQESNSGSERDTMYDVVFDTPFNAGMKLNCSEGRGYRLPKYSFINISYGKRLLEQKTGKTDEVIAASQFNMPNNKFNGNTSYNNQAWPLYDNSKQQQPVQNFGQTNSAFAQFTSSSYQRPTYGKQGYLNDVQTNTLVPQKYSSQKQEATKKPEGFGNFKNLDFYPQFNKSSTNTQPPVRLFRDNNKGSPSKSRYDEYKSNGISKNVDGQQTQGWQWRNLDDKSANWRNLPNSSTEKTNSRRSQESQSWRNTQSAQSSDNEQPNQSTIQDKRATSWRNNESSMDNEKVNQSRGQDKQATSWRNIQADLSQNSNDSKSDEETPSRSSQGNEKRLQVNADFLKRLLQVGETSNKNIDTKKERRSVEKALSENTLKCSTTSSTTSTSTTTTTKKELVENSTAISFDQLSQVANAPASIRLLTYYQSNGLGLPRYQYFNGPEGVQAQIKLSDGQLITGKYAETREDASENVASDVLELFTKTQVKSEKTTFSNEFPPPPKVWVNSEKDKRNPTDSMSKNQNVNKKRTDTSAVLNNSFVPLQVIKSHINKNSKKSNDESKENVQNCDTTSENSSTSAKVSSTSQKSQTKPKKERKTRIAANLFNKN